MTLDQLHHVCALAERYPALEFIYCDGRRIRITRGPTRLVFDDDGDASSLTDADYAFLRANGIKPD